MMYSRNNRGFLIRPKPVVGESFIGYLYRLARVNGLNYEALVLLFKNNAAPIKSYDADDRTKIKATAYELTGHEIDLFDPWKFYLGYRSLFDYKKLKICTECFAENPVYDAKWHSRLSFACAKHNRQLIHQCPICSIDFDENALINGECMHCRAKISVMSTDIKTEQMSPALLEIIEESTKGINLEQHKLFISKLEFYMYLVGKNEFAYWDKRRDAELPVLRQIVTNALFLKENFNEAKNEILTKYCYQEGLRCITQGVLFRFFKTDEHLEYKSLFQAVVEEYAENRGDETVRFSFLALLYGIDVERLCSIAEELHIQLVSKQGGKFLRLSDLNNLIKKRKTKFPDKG